MQDELLERLFGLARWLLGIPISNTLVSFRDRSRPPSIYRSTTEAPLLDSLPTTIRPAISTAEWLSCEPRSRNRQACNSPAREERHTGGGGRGSRSRILILHRGLWWHGGERGPACGQTRSRTLGANSFQQRRQRDPTSTTTCSLPPHLIMLPHPLYIPFHAPGPTLGSDPTRHKVILGGGRAAREARSAVLGDVHCELVRDASGEAPPQREGGRRARVATVAARQTPRRRPISRIRMHRPVGCGWNGRGWSPGEAGSSFPLLPRRRSDWGRPRRGHDRCRCRGTA